MFLVFHTVKIVYICVFVNCSASCCLCNTLMDPWNVCMYENVHISAVLKVPSYFSEVGLEVLLTMAFN
jgi:hypothetical protein